MPDQTCFVIQGFNKKQDYPTGRTLDLDASYAVIKEAVESMGLNCVRADEIKHSGTINEPMFQQILDADIVIADLSTYNVNAAYELGVRHALRPYTTIIVAENQMKYPFDFSHIAIQSYEHSGFGYRTARGRALPGRAARPDCRAAAEEQHGQSGLHLHPRTDAAGPSRTTTTATAATRAPGRSRDTRRLAGASRCAASGGGRSRRHGRSRR